MLGVVESHHELFFQISGFVHVGELHVSKGGKDTTVVAGWREKNRFFKQLWDIFLEAVQNPLELN